jgi:hypothetical protein
VANGQFSYATPHPNVPDNPTPSYPATFAPDGAFFGQIIGGTHLQAGSRLVFSLFPTLGWAAARPLLSKSKGSNMGAPNR